MPRLQLSEISSQNSRCQSAVGSGASPGLRSVESFTATGLAKRGCVGVESHPQVMPGIMDTLNALEDATFVGVHHFPLHPCLIRVQVPATEPILPPVLMNGRSPGQDEAKPCWDTTSLGRKARCFGSRSTCDRGCPKCLWGAHEPALISCHRRHCVYRTLTIFAGLVLAPIVPDTVRTSDVAWRGRGRGWA